MATEFLFYDATLVYALQRVLSPLPLLPTITTLCSSLGDPRYAYMFTFPLVYWLLGPRAGVHTLIVAALAEWLNITLKWLLLGDRPFWWVEERKAWPQEHQLLQLPITCETGPGNPSGHVMVTLSVLLTALQYVYTRNDAHTSCVTNLLRVGVGLFAGLIGLSRIYTSTHFVHQVVLGLVGGLLIHTLACHSTTLQSRLLLSRQNSRDYLVFSLLLLLVCVAIYQIWTWLGFDPSFSVEKAIRACKNPSWIHLDTTPFYSLVRSVGSILGLGMVAWGYEGSWNADSAPLRSRLPGIALTYALIAGVSYVPVPTSNSLVFYAISLVKCSLFPLIVIVGKTLC